MNCPTCSKPIITGEMSLGPTGVQLVSGIGGFAELQFNEPDRDPITVMRLSDASPGLHCKDCDTFVIVNDAEKTESECMFCHTTISSGETSCSKCGWSYK